MTGQCGNTIFPYETYTEGAFDLEAMLENAHEKDIKVVTYVDFAGVLTTTENSENYAKRDTFGNRQMHWPWIAYATCPNNPDWQEYCLEETRGVMELGFDGLFFDGFLKRGRAGPVARTREQESFPKKPFRAVAVLVLLRF